MAAMRAALPVLALLATLAVAAPRAAAEPPGMAGDRWLGVDILFGKMRLLNDLSLISVTPSGGVRVGDALYLGGRIPVAVVHANDSATTLGNLTLELYYLLGDGHGVSWLDTSLSLPTANDSGDGGAAAAAHATFWLIDPGLYAPSTTTFRVGGHHAVWEPGHFFELGGQAQYLSRPGQDALHILLSLSGGARLTPRMALFGAIDAAWNVDSQNGEEDLLSALRFGLRLAGRGRGHGEVAIYYPLDDSYRNGFEAVGLLLTIVGGM
jgi:hypothetical protein